MIIDNALLRFKTTFAQAKKLGDSKVANVFDKRFLCILPIGEYLQTSNFETDVNFGGDYKAELVDCCDRVLKDITSSVFIDQSYNSVTGKQNISVEIINVGDMYPNWGVATHLKISHSAGGQPNSKLVIWSNPFTVAYNAKEVMRIDYRGFGVNNGVDYTNANFMQSFGVRGWFNKFTDETETQKYLTTQGSTITSDAVVSIQSEYTFEHVTAYAQKALAYWTRSPLFYLNGIRHTSPQLTLGEREGNSNFYEGKLSAYANESDVYTPVYQIAPPLSFTPIYPVGVYTLAGLQNRIEGQFNYPITLGTGYLRVFKANGDPGDIFSQDDIIVNGNSFVINEKATMSNGEYYITFDEGLFIFPFGLNVYTYDWRFKTGAADWLNTDWNNSDFFTN